MESKEVVYLIEAEKQTREWRYRQAVVEHYLLWVTSLASSNSSMIL